MRSDVIKKGAERAPHRSLLLRHRRHRRAVYVQRDRHRRRHRDGARVRIDFSSRRIDPLVPDALLEQRRRDWKPVDRPLTGWLARYRRKVTNASHGAGLGGQASASSNMPPHTLQVTVPT